MIDGFLQRIKLIDNDLIFVLTKKTRQILKNKNTDWMDFRGFSRIWIWL
jgi:hypothetical protein